MDIIRGVLAPHTKLNLRELADRYKVGVIPLREALSRLATTGFVTAEDGRGFRVSGVSPEEIVDITRVRTLIETEALRDSIEHGDVEWEARVMGALHRLNRTPTIAPAAVSETAEPRVHSAWEAAHAGFHDALLSGCRSRWLLVLAATLRDQADRYRYLTLLSQPKRDVGAEHKGIAEAAIGRDGDLACKRLAAHLAETTRRALRGGGNASPSPAASPVLSASGRRRPGLPSVGIETSAGRSDPLPKGRGGKGRQR